MQFLADIIKKLINERVITINDLYKLSEEEIIEIIKNSNIKECFDIWQNSLNIKTSLKNIPNKYCIKNKAKKRYIDSLVKINDKITRISKVSNKAKANIDKCLNYDFNLENKTNSDNLILISLRYFILILPLL